MIESQNVPYTETSAWDYIRQGHDAVKDRIETHLTPFDVIREDDCKERSDYRHDKCIKKTPVESRSIISEYLFDVFGSK